MRITRQNSHQPIYPSYSIEAGPIGATDEMLVRHPNIALIREPKPDTRPLFIQRLLPHRHSFRMMDWNKEKFGPDLETLNGNYTLYRYHYGCACGREIIFFRCANI